MTILRFTWRALRGRKMGGVTEQLDIKKVLLIIKLRERKRWGYKAIAREVGVHWQTARKYIKLYEGLGHE